MTQTLPPSKFKRLVRKLAWPIRSSSVRARVASASLVVTLALGWVAGVDYTSRGAGTAFVLTYAILITVGVYNFYGWRDEHK